MREETTLKIDWHMPANERTTDLQIRKKYELYGLAKIKGDKKNCKLKNLNLKASSI